MDGRRWRQCSLVNGACTSNHITKETRNKQICRTICTKCHNVLQMNFALVHYWWVLYLGVEAGFHGHQCIITTQRELAHIFDAISLNVLSLALKGVDIFTRGHSLCEC